MSKSLSDVSRCATNVSAAYNAKTEDAGNGSLMRFAPVPVFIVPIWTNCAMWHVSLPTRHTQVSSLRKLVLSLPTSIVVRWSHIRALPPSFWIV